MNLTVIFSCGNFVDMANTNSLRPVVDRDPLCSEGADHSDWLRNFTKRKEYVLTTPLQDGKNIKEAGPSDVLTASEGGEKVEKGKAQRMKRLKKSNKGKGVVADQSKAGEIILADAECYECHGKGHWRRDCPQLKTKKLIQGPGVYVFENIFLANISENWILDSGSIAHIGNM